MSYIKVHSFLLADVEQKSSVLYSPLTSFNWCCKVYAIRQALRAYCPQIYNVIIVVPLLLCKVNSKVTVTLRYTEALKLHCFLKKTVHLQGFWPKTVYLKCFGIQLKTVYLQGPCSSRPCISRPCCIFERLINLWATVEATEKQRWPEASWTGVFPAKF